MKKSQMFIEFFILIGLAFLAVILFVAASANEISEFKDTKEFLLIKDLALKLQKEVNIANSVEEGYERSFTLPERLENNVDYYIQIRNNSLTINSSKAVFSVAIVNITGDFNKGQNKIEKKDDGSLYVTNT
ncbi:MAG: hypothetical protein V1831_01015 [Candidatus Woesearchaeota archaeon]